MGIIFNSRGYYQYGPTFAIDSSQILVGISHNEMEILTDGSGSRERKEVGIAVTCYKFFLTEVWMHSGDY